MPQRRTLLALTAATLVASTAVGALAVQALGGGPKPIVLSGVESGMLPLADAADQAARAWQRDAYLVRAMATEGAPLDGRVDPPFLYDTSPDPLVGNGRAVAWTFAYASPAEPGRLFFATVGGDGSVLYRRALVDPHGGCCYAMVAEGSARGSPSDAPVRGHHGRGAGGPAPLARVSYDADGALARVADHPGFRDFAADHPVFQASLELAQGPEGRPAWSITYRTATAYGAAAVVDASTGDTLRVDAWPHAVEPQPYPAPPPEPHPCCAPRDHHETYHSRLGPGRQEHRVAVPVESAEHAREVVVRAGVEGALPVVQEAVLQVLDGNGRPLAHARGGPVLEARVEAFADPGPYTAVLYLTSNVAEVATVLDVRVRYAPDPRPPAREARFESAVHPWGGTAYFPLAFSTGMPTRVTLEWAASLPTDGMELSITDQHGNEVEAVRQEGGGGSLALDVPPGLCCLQAVVRNAGEGLQEQRFGLVVEIGPWWRGDAAEEGAGVHHGHAH